jgi:hypothetical protein
MKRWLLLSFVVLAGNVSWAQGEYKCVTWSNEILFMANGTDEQETSTAHLLCQSGRGVASLYKNSADCDLRSIAGSLSLSSAEI